MAGKQKDKACSFTLYEPRKDAFESEFEGDGEWVTEGLLISLRLSTALFLRSIIRKRAFFRGGTVDIKLY